MKRREYSISSILVYKEEIKKKEDKTIATY